MFINKICVKLEFKNIRNWASYGKENGLTLSKINQYSKNVLNL